MKYRQSVMKAIGGHMGSIAAVVKGEVSHGPHVANHARGIKDMSLIVPDIFPPNSTYDDYNKTDGVARNLEGAGQVQEGGRGVPESRG